jgi:hypothetical protein
MGSANQAVTPGRTSLLEAVNVMLQAIGELPINSLEEQQIPEASMAERTLLQTHREGQIRGWWWNRETERVFPVDSQQLVRLPDNVLRFAPNLLEGGGRWVLRGQRLFDSETKSYALPADITSITADVVVGLSWDDSPEAYNRWATMSAARVFAARTMTGDSTIQYLAAEERAALEALLSVEYEANQPNALTGGIGPYPTYTAGLGLLGRRIGGY